MVAALPTSHGEHLAAGRLAGCAAGPVANSPPVAVARPAPFPQVPERADRSGRPAAEILARVENAEIWAARSPVRQAPTRKRSSRASPSRLVIPICRSRTPPGVYSRGPSGKSSARAGARSCRAQPQPKDCRTAQAPFVRNRRQASGTISMSGRSNELRMRPACNPKHDMNDAERVQGLLDLVDPDRARSGNRGPELAVLGLARLSSRGGAYRPTAAGWVLLGEQGRRFQPGW